RTGRLLAKQGPHGREGARLRDTRLYPALRSSRCTHRSVVGRTEQSRPRVRDLACHLEALRELSGTCPVFLTEPVAVGCLMTIEWLSKLMEPVLHGLVVRNRVSVVRDPQSREDVLHRILELLPEVVIAPELAGVEH